MHTHLQLDPSAQVSLRPGKDGAIEIVILGPDSDDWSGVIELSPRQLAAICEAASES
jgi:hypothetical protein